jgi:hypothetical protein
MPGMAGRGQHSHDGNKAMLERDGPEPDGKIVNTLSFLRREIDKCRYRLKIRSMCVSHLHIRLSVSSLLTRVSETRLLHT